nr:MAG TPA: hypothetical protein [Microviridae sp.]
MDTLNQLKKHIIDGSPINQQHQYSLLNQLLRRHKTQSRRRRHSKYLIFTVLGDTITIIALITGGISLALLPILQKTGSDSRQAADSIEAGRSKNLETSAPSLRSSEAESEPKTNTTNPITTIYSDRSENDRETISNAFLLSNTQTVPKFSELIQGLPRTSTTKKQLMCPTQSENVRALLQWYRRYQQTQFTWRSGQDLQAYRAEQSILSDRLAAIERGIRCSE